MQRKNSALRGVPSWRIHRRTLPECASCFKRGNIKIMWNIRILRVLFLQIAWNLWVSIFQSNFWDTMLHQALSENKQILQLFHGVTSVSLFISWKEVPEQSRLGCCVRFHPVMAYSNELMTHKICNSNNSKSTTKLFHFCLVIFLKPFKKFEWWQQCRSWSKLTYSQ